MKFKLVFWARKIQKFSNKRYIKWE